MATRKITAAVARAQKGGTKNHPILGAVPKPGSGRWDGAMRGVPLLGPVPKQSMHRHEGSSNNTDRSGMFVGLGKVIGGPLKPKPKR